jgi:hypothetical protein
MGVTSKRSSGGDNREEQELFVGSKGAGEVVIQRKPAISLG